MTHNASQSIGLDRIYVRAFFRGFFTPPRRTDRCVNNKIHFARGASQESGNSAAMHAVFLVQERRKNALGYVSSDRSWTEDRVPNRRVESFVCPASYSDRYSG
jgi:hypothetical protein